MYNLINKNGKLWGSGYLCIYEYTYPLNTNFDVIIINFIKDENYLIDDRSSLGNPFNFEFINCNDLKKLNRKELYDFFDAFADPKGWSDPKEIKNEIHFFKSITNENEEFYMLSIDFFERNNPNLFEFKSEKLNFVANVYLYYFLIFWFKNDKMYLCLMCLD